MLQKADKNMEVRLLEYFEQDLKHCLYSYIDLKKYGLEDDHLQIYVQMDGDQILCTAVKYYNGLQVFAGGTDFDPGEIAGLVDQIRPDMISGPNQMIQMIRSLLTNYDLEEGFVTELKSLSSDAREALGACKAEMAGIADLPEIAELICSDKVLGGHYQPEALVQQLQERLEDDFGRNYVIRSSGRIEAHAATYAETNNLGVISGVITREECRGQGLGYLVMIRLCADLLAEGKTPCLFYYTEASDRLYKKIGFEPGSEWAKLSRKQG